MKTKALIVGMVALLTGCDLENVAVDGNGCVKYNPPPVGECTYSTLKGTWQDSDGKGVAINYNCEINSIRCPMRGQISNITETQFELEVTIAGNNFADCWDYGTYVCDYIVTHETLRVDCGDANGELEFDRNF